MNTPAQEAYERFHEDVDPETGVRVDDWGYAECERRAFVEGVRWFSTGIEALADEWGATARAEQSVAANAALPRGVRALADARWEIGEKYVNALRALLSTNDEKAAQA